MSFALKHIHIPHYTYDDYCLWEGRWELLNGVPYSMSPAPSIPHQSIVGNIYSQLTSLLDNCNNNCQVLLSPVDWKMSDETVVQPDVMVACGDLKDKYLDFAPEIVFEVLSDSTKEKDRTVKYEIYQSEGVKYYVIVNTKQKNAEVFQLKNKFYSKIKETKTETVRMDIKECPINFDFKKIW